jgi:prepilin-type N-terminal cleavage/methylation domain-containing protein
MKRSLRKSGFTLTEVIMALSMLVIFFAVSGQLFRSTMMLGWAGTKASDRASRVDFAMERLRADAWGAQTITVPSPQTVTFSEAGGTSVSWKIESDDRLVRQQDQDPPQTFDGVGEKWSFSGDVISLNVSDGLAAPERLMGQMLLAGRGHP